MKKMVKTALTKYGVFTLLWTVISSSPSVLVSKDVFSWGPDSSSSPADMTNAIRVDTKGHVPISRLLLVLQPEYSNTSSTSGEVTENNQNNTMNTTTPSDSASSNNNTLNLPENDDVLVNKTEFKSKSRRDLNEDELESLSRKHRTFAESETNLSRVKRQYGGGGGGGGGYGGGGGGGSGLYPILDQSLSILGYTAFFSFLIMAVMSLLGNRMPMMGRGAAPNNDDPGNVTPPQILDDPDANCLQWIRCQNKKVPWKIGVPNAEKMVYQVPMSSIPEPYRDCSKTFKPCTPLTYVHMINKITKMRDKWK